MAIVLALAVSVPMFVTSGIGGSPNKSLGPPAFVLNLIGKKMGWSPNGDFDNPDRHTIFVPEDTTGYNQAPYGNLTVENSVLIWMTSGSEFAVIDGNACDEGNASLQVGPDRYIVCVAVKGKPGGSSTLKGWYYDDEGYTCYQLGTTKSLSRNKGQPVWVDVTDIFYISWQQILAATPDIMEADVIAWLLAHGYSVGDNVWIFDFLKALEEVMGDTDYYFWQLANSGCKLIQVRFYPA